VGGGEGGEDREGPVGDGVAMVVVWKLLGWEYGGKGRTDFEISQDLFLGEDEEIAGCYSGGVEVYAAEGCEFLGLF